MNEEYNSEAESDAFDVDHEKPNNRATISLKSFNFCSNFPGGNLREVKIQQDIMIDNRVTAVVQFWSNSDTNSDATDKAWFYFCLSGIRENRNLKYSQILFRFKNANSYRKFVKEKKYRPYIALKEIKSNSIREWKTLFLTKIYILQNQVLQAEFIYKILPGIDQVYFASNLPYNLSNLHLFNDSIFDYIQNHRKSDIYFHRETIAQSVDGHPVFMWTITSADNVTGYTTMEAQLWPYKGIRPFVLKDKPEIVITSRVHPSEVVGSLCVEGIVQQLIKGDDFQLLKHLFIFRIIPMMNPDGIENGHYRLDNFYQNLNRFYGHSDVKKTPSVFAVEKLLINLRAKDKLFFFMDIHGHNSPKPSFLFGNFTTDFFRSLQNRVFARVLQALSNEGFSYLDSQFSKRNMQIKEKYDQHSKQGCARVFAFQGTSSAQSSSASNHQGLVKYVDHSYTLQVQPFLTKSSKKAVESENQLNSTFNQANQVYSQSLIYKQYKNLGKQVLVAILQLIGCNTLSKGGEMEPVQEIRKRCQKQISKLQEAGQKNKKQSKDLNRDIMERYNNKWGFFSSFKEFLDKNHGRKPKLEETVIFKLFFQKVQKNSKAIATNKLSSNNLNIFRSKSKLDRKQKNHLNLNNSTENINSSQIYVRIESFKKENTKASYVKIGKSFNDSIQKSIQQVLSNEKIDISNNQIVLKQFTPSFSLLRKRQHLPTQNESQMEKRMKRMIFKHKTQIQANARNNYRSLNNQKIQLQLKELIQQSRYKQKTKRLKQEEAMGNQNNKAAPIQAKYSLQQNLPRDVIDWKNGKKYKKTEIKQYFKAQVISSHNPTIKQLLKRVSIFQRNKKKDGNEENGSNQRIRSSQSVLNNLIGIRSTKEVIQNKQKHQQESDNKVFVYDSNRTFLPLMYQQKMIQKVYSSPSYKRLEYKSERCEKPVLSPPSPLKKVKVKTSPKKQKQQQQSLQRVRQKNIEFIERAKDTLLEKKKMLKIQQS